MAAAVAAASFANSLLSQKTMVAAVAAASFEKSFLFNNLFVCC